MKKIILSLAVVALLFTTSCKNETTEEAKTEMTTEGSENLAELEAAYNDAVAKLEEAKKSGDIEAEKLAQEAVDQAKASWEAAANATIEVNSDLQEGLEETKSDLKEAKENAEAQIDKSASEAKEAINTAKNDAVNSANVAKDNAVESARKAKADAEAAAAKAKEDVKKGYNNSLEKMKVN